MDELGRGGLKPEEWNGRMDNEEGRKEEWKNGMEGITHETETLVGFCSYS